MGGRGSTSSFISGTSNQVRKIQNIRRIAERDNYIDLQFKRNKDGSIDYSYERQRRVEYVHGGKMQDPSKMIFTKEQSTILE